MTFFSFQWQTTSSGTDHGGPSGKVQKKSGQKRCNLTASQKWVERNFGFLRKHIVHRPQGTQLGQISTDEEDEDSE